jgi:hypothetical protein
MPFLLNNPAHWCLRAMETRLLADQLTDLVAKATILRIAEEYDQLATRAAQRLQGENEIKAD